MLKKFYGFILHWIEFDLVVARSTGRNPTHIAQLNKEKEAYSGLLLDLDMNS